KIRRLLESSVYIYYLLPLPPRRDSVCLLIVDRRSSLSFKKLDSFFSKSSGELSLRGLGVGFCSFAFFMDRLILPSSPTDRSFTSISSYTLRCSLLSSSHSSATPLTSTSPLFHPRNSRLAPKLLIPVTFPITLLPTSTDILLYYPPNYHLLSLYSNTIK